MYLVDNLDQSIGPLPLFPVIYPPHLPNCTCLGEREGQVALLCPGALSRLSFVPNLDVFCSSGTLFQTWFTTVLILETLTKVIV